MPKVIYARARAHTHTHTHTLRNTDAPCIVSICAIRKIQVEQPAFEQVKLPMTALPGGTEPSKGVMTHTGAFCPSFDKEWTIKDVCNRDLSDEDHTLLASFNLFVKKSEPAEPTAKLDRMPPGMLKESSTLTGIRKHAQVLASK